MTVTDQTLLDNARNALNEIILSQAEEMTQEKRAIVQIKINDLNKLISSLERKIATASGRRIHKRVLRTNQ